ncbi:hypothetical protein [Brenneria tiliae]|uniref:hypothetical protein n=1 Tax=Brenneria tiliae TaxID=2914984 RepID=UPI002014D70F|nr:hypothetical protein [Brenneria tiliae]MCL2897143.1 hypothetical protein [Brenneria tiliae]MCL2904796.1 hypothetical protein [Brenneria tiliae]
MEKQLHQQDADFHALDLDIASFFGLTDTSHVKKMAHIGLTARSYLPKLDDPRSDWVASVAVPAFQTLAKRDIQAPNFCTIGTGAGLDALAAIEILNARNVALTDLHKDVVAMARVNILNNLKTDHDVALFSGAGDLFQPLSGISHLFDLIYENLPNIPILGGVDLSEDQASSTFIEDRSEDIPGFVSQNLVALHYLILREATSLLNDGGRILSSIGGRIPLETILRLAGETGYDGRILTYTWKIQSEPEEVIGGYAQWENQGLGPFHFYPIHVLDDTFNNISPAEAGQRAIEIEASLKSYQLNATTALAEYQKGMSFGHTVAVLESRKK